MNASHLKILLWITMTLAISQIQSTSTTEPTMAKGPLSLSSPSSQTPRSPEVATQRRSPEVVSPTHSDLPCTFIVSDITLDDFVYYLKTRSYKFMYLKLKFPQEARVSYLDHVFRPREWMWTFQTNQGAETFLQWTRDYRVLSLGILDTYTRKELEFELETSPTNCSVVLGSENTTQAISDAFANMLMTTVSAIKADYNTSIWCFHEITTVSDIPDMIATLLGIHSRVLIKRCCRLRFDVRTRLRSAYCSMPPIAADQFTDVLMSSLGVVALLYFPIWLSSVCFNLSNKAIPTSAADTARHSDLDLNVSHNIVWLYQGTRSPVTLSSAFTRTFPSFKRHPVITSRLQRFAFIYALPVVLYVRLLLYYVIDFHYLSDCVDRDIPIGTLAVLFGFEKSRRNVFTILGGPYVLFGVYFIIGPFVLCLPRDLSREMCSRLQKDETQGGIQTPLRLDLDVISKLGSTNCPKNDNSFKLICRVLQANLFMLINFDFWKLTSKTQYGRYIEIAEKLSHLPLVTKYGFMTPISVLYILFCMTETFMCVLYYGVPLVYFVVLMLRVLVTLVLNLFGHSAALNHMKNPIGPILKSFKYPASLLMVLIVFYNMIAICSILYSTFTFLMGVMTFTFISVIAFPGVAFGYFLFGTTGLFYVWSAVRDIDIGYMELFKNTIQVSKTLDKADQSEVPAPIQVIKTLDKADQSEVPAPENDVQKNKRRVPLLREIDGRPGIPKDLFEMVIERHRPFRVCVLTSIFKLGACFLVFYITFTLIQSFGKLREISTIVSLLSTLLVVSFPRVLSLVLDDTDNVLVREDFIRRLTKTVKEYWHHKDRRDLVSACVMAENRV